MILGGIFIVKKKIIVITIMLLATVVGVIAWVGRNSNMLRKMDASEVDRITFQDSIETITISEREHIQEIFHELQTMKFKSMLGHHRFGSALVFDIKLKSGQKYTFSILSDDIIVNGKNYKPDQDYRDELKSIVDRLS